MTVTVIGVGQVISSYADQINVCIGSTDSAQLDINTSQLCGIRSCGSSILAYAPTDTTSSSVSGSPFNFDTVPHHEQHLYRSSILTGMGLQTGVITKIGIRLITNLSGGSYTNVKLSLGCTIDSTLSIATGFIGVTEVWSTASYTPFSGGGPYPYNVFTLTSPYMWHSTSNLVLDWCQTAGPGTPDQWAGFNPGYAGRMYELASGCGSACPSTVSTTHIMAIKLWQGCQNVYTYSWSPNAGLSDSTIINPKALPSTTTSYIITVIDTTNTTCLSQDFVTINSGASFSLTVTAIPDSVCSGSAVSLNAAASGLSGSYSYEWSPSTIMADNTIQDPKAYPSISGLLIANVTHEDGCLKSASKNVNVSNDPPVVTAIVDMAGGYMDSICGDSTRLIAILSEGGATIKYLWSPTTGLSNPNSDTTWAFPTKTTTYTLSAWDSTVSNPCIAISGVTVYDSCQICDTITWTGNIDSSWIDWQNWNIGIVPTSCNPVVIPGTNSVENLPLINVSTASVKNITIKTDDGAKITIQSSGVLTIQD
ncbi:MAG: hypothetical protein IH946_00770 [Bacteroidetes bacterium]|nr:hypothetical protein [Bacteroidota bacterium]